MRRSDRRVLAALRLAGDDGAYALDIMDATGLWSGTVYPALLRLHRKGLVEPLPRRDSGRCRYRAVASVVAVVLAACVLTACGDSPDTSGEPRGEKGTQQVFNEMVGLP